MVDRYTIDLTFISFAKSKTFLVPSNIDEMVSTGSLTNFKELVSEAE